MRPEFISFDSIKRLSRECTIAEKIDGTNGLIHITDDFNEIYAGSRTKWITPDDDNKGFARWVEEHKDELIKGLGPGTHAGEWWGQGIGRRYGLKEKRFSLFNVGRWNEDNKPACCHIVPVLYKGPFDTTQVDSILDLLKQHGSYAAPGFMDPEGVVIYHEAARVLFKKTLGGDGHKNGRLM